MTLTTLKLPAPNSVMSAVPDGRLQIFSTFDASTSDISLRIETIGLARLFSIALLNELPASGYRRIGYRRPQNPGKKKKEKGSTGGGGYGSLATPRDIRVRRKGARVTGLLPHERTRHQNVSDLVPLSARLERDESLLGSGEVPASVSRQLGLAPRTHVAVYITDLPLPFGHVLLLPLIHKRRGASVTLHGADVMEDDTRTDEQGDLAKVAVITDVQDLEALLRATERHLNRDARLTVDLVKALLAVRESSDQQRPHYLVRGHNPFLVWVNLIAQQEAALRNDVFHALLALCGRSFGQQLAESNSDT
ncbi:hypothetical protein BDK51DRAFT_48989 [Blyttiomyces helicus]|uniref:Uncharacterized protein n=1 Tax=Blyttiomyces helicus TaxID=388810 RepID=A0A4P9W1N8_9FUNG|nr:hypothetical protein BDK51DRAFT_48989 [Blyttiomyces helicus]|eukprot:RKO84490.1 hypothetical protein BDK51DRAFT_48989 [Blyttiomyces helicus]